MTNFTPEGTPGSQPFASANTASQPTLPERAPGRGLALGAIIVGGVAFLIGLVPVVGFVVGLAGLGLGIFALIRRQPKLLPTLGIALASVAILTSALTTVALAIGAATVADQAPIAVAPTTTVAPSPTPFPAPSIAPTATPSAAAPVVDPAAFAADAHKQVADINKDLDDMVERTTNRQMIRLIGNSIELDFNLAQLKALTPPPALAETWGPAIAGLDQSIDVAGTTTTSFTSDQVSPEVMLAAIDAVRAQAANVDALISQVG